MCGFRVTADGKQLANESRRTSGTMLLSELIQGLEVLEIKGEGDCQVSGIAYDSRRVRKGSIFVALRGCVTDGNKFVPEALARGAAAIVSEHAPAAGADATWIRVPDARRALAQLSLSFFGNPSERMKLVGVTGTNGKTTTAHLVEAILRASGEKVCLLGTIANRLYQQGHLSELTTPEAPDICAFLDSALKAGCRYGVMEVSSHALDRMRVHGLKFKVAAFTNLTRDHLDYHGDFESYFRAKRKLFIDEEGNSPELAVVNIDDAWGRRLAQEINSGSHAELITFGTSSDAHVRPLKIDCHAGGIELVAQTWRGQQVSANSSLVGRANAYNILAAIAIASALGVPAEAIRSGIAELKSVPGRFERIECGQDFTVIVDYAHTDDALRNLLQIARDLAAGRGRIITVFGCGGDRDRTKRPLMGEVAGRLSDLVVVTSDNPRSEDPEEIMRQIEPGLSRVNANYVKIADRRQAIAYALRQARPGDLVVIAGKGHETVQVLKDRTIPFDDREVARQIIGEILNG